MSRRYLNNMHAKLAAGPTFISESVSCFSIETSFCPVGGLLGFSSAKWCAPMLHVHSKMDII